MDKTFTLSHFLADFPPEFDESFCDLPFPDENPKEEQAPGDDVIRFLMDYSMSFDVMITEQTGLISCFHN